MNKRVYFSLGDDIRNLTWIPNEDTQFYSIDLPEDIIRDIPKS